MKYRAQFSNGWQGTWEFEALNDARAWETVRDFVSEHTSTVYVTISEIWELDESGNAVRKLDGYEEYFTPYKIYFDGGDYIQNIYREKDDFLVWNEAIRTIRKTYNSEVNRIEELERLTNARIHQLDSYAECKKNRVKIRQRKDRIENQEDKEESAIYKAYFNDGECSAPYVARISENDVLALDLAEYKLKQYVDYYELDMGKIKIARVEEINEDKLFTVNLNRIEEKKNRCLALRNI
jgi:hypothetical protein